MKPTQDWRAELRAALKMPRTDEALRRISLAVEDAWMAYSRYDEIAAVAAEAGYSAEEWDALLGLIAELSERETELDE